MRGDFVMRGQDAIEGAIDIEKAPEAADTRENAIFLGENGGRSALVGVDTRVTGGVTRGTVFEQRVLQNRGDSPAIPIHWSLVVCKFRVASPSIFGLIQNPTALLACGVG